MAQQMASSAGLESGREIALGLSLCVPLFIFSCVRDSAYRHGILELVHSWCLFAVAPAETQLRVGGRAVY